MIVQTAAEGHPRFVITQRDHASVSGEFARHFGNERFGRLDPYEAMVYVVEHHDDGWDEIDRHPRLNVSTGLPFHLTQTPTDLLVASGSRSPDHNMAFHPYSGLISSMHTYGLYHGRYGLSDKVYIDMIPSHFRAAVDQMLQGELQRQEQLKQTLAQSGHQQLVTEAGIFNHYKLLQFFDTLALYIQTSHPAHLTTSRFLHIPSLDGDLVIEAIPIEPFVVSLSPWVFSQSELEVSTRGRYMVPLMAEMPAQDFVRHCDAITSDQQTVLFRKG
jgi:hypothetical protein